VKAILIFHCRSQIFELISKKKKKVSLNPKDTRIETLEFTRFSYDGSLVGTSAVLQCYKR